MMPLDYNSSCISKDLFNIQQLHNYIQVSVSLFLKLFMQLISEKQGKKVKNLYGDRFVNAEDEIPRKCRNDRFSNINSLAIMLTDHGFQATRWTSIFNICIAFSSFTEILDHYVQ